MKRTPLRPINRQRRRALHEKQFGGDKAEWLRSQPCFVDTYCPHVLNVTCEGAIEAMHTKSRGAGGTADDMVPCCAHHHSLSHTLGAKTFAEYYGVNLRLAADLFKALWQSTLERE